jgi:hypothetical protein
MTTIRSRVPDLETPLDPAHHQFLDGIDKRQQRVANLPDLAPSAALSDLIAAYNALLQTHRTK